MSLRDILSSEGLTKKEARIDHGRALRLIGEADSKTRAALASVMYQGPAATHLQDAAESLKEAARQVMSL